LPVFVFSSLVALAQNDQTTLSRRFRNQADEMELSVASFYDYSVGNIGDAFALSFKF